MDKARVQSAPGGERYFVVEREGRVMPLLNGAGEVETWTKKDVYGALYSQEGRDFIHVTLAMDHPERLKDVTPVKAAPGWGYGEF